MKRADRPLIVVLAVAAVLAPILTGGATALFFLSRQQDDRLATLRGEVGDLRRANARLFGELATKTGSKNAAATRASSLEAQVAGLQKRLATTDAQLAETRRALRWQKKVAQDWRRRALRGGSRAAATSARRAGRTPASAGP